jgi:hypothetical protein
MTGRAKFVATRSSASRAALCLAAGMLTACSDGLLHEPAPPGPGRVSLSASVLQGGTAEAYAQANTLWLLFSEGEETRLEQTVAFDGNAEEVRVPIQVPLRETSETFLLRIELRRDDDAIFQGAAEVALTAGQTAEVDIALQPVVAGVSCGGTEVLLDAYGATIQLTAAALFATGDTVPSVGVLWSTASEAPVTVNDAGVVTAQYDGTATVTCAAGGATDARSVVVLAAVTSVSVAPGEAAILIGGTQQFTAIAWDRRENIISGRTTTWTSAAPAIAQVNQAGVATGLSAGTARIDATVDGVTGSATLTVSFPPPTATTLAASGVTGVEATFNGTVNPRGTATAAWFEYGTSPTLATFTSTAQQNVGAGSANVPVDQPVSGLSEGTTYYVRIAASSVGGTTRGQIVSVSTPAPGPPAVRTISAAYAPNSDARLDMVGAVTPNGADTSFWFEWSYSDPDLNEPSSTPLQRTPAGWTEVLFTDFFFGQGVEVWVRAVAENQYGRVHGAIIRAPPYGGGA